MLLVMNTTLAAQGLIRKTSSVVDATLIDASISTKNKDGKRDPDMQQVKKGNQWHFGMKAHIAVDADSGLVHTDIGTTATVHDVTQATDLLHGEESTIWADAGYRGIEKRSEAKELAVRLQSQSSEHGLGRFHPKTTAGHGRVTLLLNSLKKGRDTQQIIYLKKQIYLFKHGLHFLLLINIEPMVYWL